MNDTLLEPVSSVPARALSARNDVPHDAMRNEGRSRAGKDPSAANRDDRRPVISPRRSGRVAPPPNRYLLGEARQNLARPLEPSTWRPPPVKSASRLGPVAVGAARITIPSENAAKSEVTR